MCEFNQQEKTWCCDCKEVLLSYPFPRGIEKEFPCLLARMKETIKRLFKPRIVTCEVDAESD